MTRRNVLLIFAIIAAAVWITRWPFRSHELFSWDSANYAMAMAKIDIASHRPHPPGYLGYVFAARAIDTVVHDPNTSLIAWNLSRRRSRRCSLPC